MTDHSQDVKTYVSAVLSGEIPTAAITYKAIERYANDVEKAKEESFPFYFDESAANHAISFISLLKHSKGRWAGSYIKLEPWQKFIQWNLFGWKRKSDATRRFRRAYIEIARKNAKTTIASAVGNYMFLADKEKGSEVFSVATKKDQAKISWDIARSQIQSNATLRSSVKMLHNTMLSGSSKFVPLSYDDKSEDGHNPHFAIIDEYHQHSSDGMLNAMETGMGSRAQPMLFIITTAGFDRESPCYLEHERAERVLTGVTEDDSYFAIIYTLDPGDDYTDKSVWIKANPNLGVSVYEEYLESMVGQAIDSPTKTNTVLTKNFNVWTQANTRWLNYEKWASANTDVFDVEDLTGRRCWAGLDLSTTTDLTAFVLNFPPERDGEKHKKIYHFFLPEENIVDRERRDGVPYRLWAQMGWIHLTPGNVIDYDWIEHVIEQEGDRFLIQEIAFDPYNATEIVNHLSEKGFTLVQFRQGYLSMNPACKEYERLVLSGKFATNNNPIMNWMVNNVEVTSDPAGNIKPTKPKHGSAKRIDGVVADIMATWRTVENISEKESVYETRGLRVI